MRVRSFQRRHQQSEEKTAQRCPALHARAELPVVDHAHTAIFLDGPNYNTGPNERARSCNREGKSDPGGKSRKTRDQKVLTVQCPFLGYD